MEKITLSYESATSGMAINIVIDGDQTVDDMCQHFASFLRAIGYPVDFGDTLEHVPYVAPYARPKSNNGEEV